MESFQTPTAFRIPATKSCSSHLLGVFPSRAAQTGFALDLSKAITFFVLCPILVKFQIRTRLIESFPTIFRTWWCAEEKLHFTPFPILRQLKRDEARFHHLGGSWSFEGGAGRYLVAVFFWGVGKIWRPCDLRYRSYKRLYTHGHTHTYGHTHTRRLIYTSRTRVIPRTFKGFWKVY